MVHGILLAHVPPSDAEDLAQQTFLATWRGLDRLRDESQVGAWIAGIARNLARRHHARRPAPALELDESIAAPRADDGDADDEDLGARVLEHLRALPEAYRETLALRLVEGMSGPEIAAARGLTHGSVRVNLTRGMKLLRERLAREEAR